MNRKACKLSAESVVSKKTKLLKLGIISFITGSVMGQFTILNAQIAFCMSERFSVILPWIIINMFKNIIEISFFFPSEKCKSNQDQTQKTEHRLSSLLPQTTVFNILHTVIIVSAGSKERGVKGGIPSGIDNTIASCFGNSDEKV